MTELHVQASTNRTKATATEEFVYLAEMEPDTIDDEITGGPSLALVVRTGSALQDLIVGKATKREAERWGRMMALIQSGDVGPHAAAVGVMVRGLDPSAGDMSHPNGLPIVISPRAIDAAVALRTVRPAWEGGNGGIV